MLALPLLDAIGLSQQHPRTKRWIRAAVWVVAIAVTLQTFGINLFGLVVLLAVLAAAAMLVFRSALEDHIAGVLIEKDGNLVVGDEIRIGPHQGRVEEIGARYTKLREPGGTMHVVPNGEIRGFAKLRPEAPAAPHPATDHDSPESTDQGVDNE
jgi:small-conductance mechanosensitive channel